MAQDILMTPGSGEPQILFRGSGTTDTAVELNVLSSYQSGTGSGTALLFEGTEGQLFGITDNLSSGTIFSVADITGLPIIEADASGDVKLGEYGRYVGIGMGVPAYGLDVFSSGILRKGVILSNYVPATTTNALYNEGGTLKFNGSSVGGASAESQYASGQAISNQSNITALNTASGVATSLVASSGIATYASGQAIENEGLATYASGQAIENETDIGYVSGIAVYTSGVAAYASGQAIENEGLATYASGNTANIAFGSNAEGDILYHNGTSFIRLAKGSNDTVLTMNGNVPNWEAAGGGSSLTAASGIVVDGADKINIYGGTGNLQEIQLTSDNIFTPKMIFTGSGVQDTPVTLKVLSSHASVNTSGTALSFEGTQGQLFGITDNLSSGNIFSVNDITGLPLISADASGDVKIGQFGRYVGIGTGVPLYGFDVSSSGQLQKGVILSDYVPATTTNTLYNDGGALKFNGSAVGGGTVQGTDGTYDIQPTNEGATTGNARGENSVDLQTVRNASTQVANGLHSVIGGGKNNTASGTASVVSGGCSNTASASSTVIAGGGGMVGNTASNTYSTVGGGEANTSSGFVSTLNGGYNNTSSGSFSTVSGGCSNTASASYSTVGGGRNNCASTQCSTVAGGWLNTASNSVATVGGGYNNTASGFVSTVSGGYSNTSSGELSTVGGGKSNTASSYSSTVGGGYNNVASAYCSTVSGGASNIACGQKSTVLGGALGVASRVGEVSHAAGGFSSVKGSAQHTLLVARRSTTDATANQEVLLDANQRLDIPAETTWMFTVKLAAHNDTDGEGAWWNFRGGIVRDGAGNTSIIGSVVHDSYADTSLSAASASVVADDTNEALEIRVTGVAGKNIRWVAVVDISQVSWGTP